jgi:DNA topoisomerase-1
LAKSRSLVVVESPTKVKTIQKYLDSGFVVKASMGHIRDLPKSKLGVNEKKGFKPEYRVLPAKKKVLDDLKKAAEKVGALYLATDPDREGEAIGWHLAQELGVDRKNTHRIASTDHRRAVKAAPAPREDRHKKVDAQQACRVLTGSSATSSPRCWEKIRGAVGGRVQSVAVRLITEREREVRPSCRYWSPTRGSARTRLIIATCGRSAEKVASRRGIHRRVMTALRCLLAVKRDAAGSPNLRPSSPPPCSRTPAGSSTSRRKRP